MRKMRRIFLIVLDSLGIGAAPDYADFQDCAENHTLRRIAADPAFRCDTVRNLGMGYIPGVEWMGHDAPPVAAVGRLTEKSRGKDTTTGHWELAGRISTHPMPTYPHGFPDSVMQAFCRATGRGFLGNRPASGTQILQELGDEHLASGKLIVYTSADSVFQIAAHESIVPPEQLYAYCRAARQILTGENGVGRVIARPFTGTSPHWVRTANRRDFSLEPPPDTMLDVISGAGMDVIGIGKIADIFAGRGITQSFPTHSNEEGMARLQQWAEKNFHGLCFANLVDFDSLYGHRNDVSGYAKAFAAFDAWLGGFLPLLGEEDVLVLTADHGCDPGDVSTDHTREYVPCMLYGKTLPGGCFGTRPSFADLAAVVTQLLGVDYDGDGQAFSFSAPDISGSRNSDGKERFDVDSLFFP